MILIEFLKLAALRGGWLEQTSGQQFYYSVARYLIWFILFLLPKSEEHRLFGWAVKFQQTDCIFNKRKILCELKVNYSLSIF